MLRWGGGGSMSMVQWLRMLTLKHRISQHCGLSLLGGGRGGGHGGGGYM